MSKIYQFIKETQIPNQKCYCNFALTVYYSIIGDLVMKIYPNSGPPIKVVPSLCAAKDFKANIDKWVENGRVIEIEI